jgi:hypothetical protein
MDWHREKLVDRIHAVSDIGPSIPMYLNIYSVITDKFGKNFDTKLTDPTKHMYKLHYNPSDPPVKPYVMMLNYIFDTYSLENLEVVADELERLDELECPDWEYPEDES